jgi:hypothetical protein
MITLPIAEADAAILLEVLERVPEREHVGQAIATAPLRGAVRHVGLSKPDAEWLYDHLAPLHRSLLENRKRSGKERRILTTLNRITPMLAYRLER